MLDPVGLDLLERDSMPASTPLRQQVYNAKMALDYDLSYSVHDYISRLSPCMASTAAFPRTTLEEPWEELLCTRRADHLGENEV